MQLGWEALPEYVDDHQSSSSRVVPSSIIYLIFTMYASRTKKSIGSVSEFGVPGESKRQKF